MLYTIAIISLLTWLLSLLTSFTISGFVHLLPLVAIVALLLKVLENPCDRWE